MANTPATRYMITTEIENLDVQRLDRSDGVVERHALAIAASFLTLGKSHVVDHELPHRFCRERKEVVAVFEVETIVIEELHVDVVDERGRGK